MSGTLAPGSADAAKPVKLPGSAEPTPGRCGGKLRRSLQKYGHWRYCLKQPEPGGKRCKQNHGGRGLMGPANPAYTNGQYSTALTGSRLHEHVVAAMNDPKLMSLRWDIALMTGRASELLERWTAGEGGGSVKAVSKYAADVKVAQASRNMRAAAEAMTHLFAAIDALSKTDALMENIKDTVNQRARLISAEVGHAFKAHQAMNATQTKVLVDRIVDAIVKNVTNTEDLRRVLAGIETVVAHTAAEPSDTEDAAWS